MRVDCARAIQSGTRTHAPGHSFVVRKLLAGAGVDAAHGQVVHSSLTGGGNAIGQRLGQGLEHHVDNPL